MQPRALTDRFANTGDPEAMCLCCSRINRHCVCSPRTCTDCFSCLACCKCQGADARSNHEPRQLGSVRNVTVIPSGGVLLSLLAFAGLMLVSLWDGPAVAQLFED